MGRRFSDRAVTVVSRTESKAPTAMALLEPGNHGVCDADPVNPSVIHAARGGDAEAFAYLFRRYSARVFALARRYFAPGNDRDDLVQEATIGFFKAIRDFRGDRGSFGSFVELCVRRQIITFIKSATRQKHALLNSAISIDAPVFEDSDDSLASRLAARGKVDIDETTDAVSFLTILAERCSDLERGVLSLYARGYTFAEMAWELGVHYKSIDNAVWRVKVKAKRLISEKKFGALTARYLLEDIRAS